MASEPVNGLPDAHFNVENMRDFFQQCVREDGTIDIEKYILGYEEIYKFLHLLGTVFGWVASDVHAKLQILRDHRADEKTGQHYQSIKAMVEYEVKEDLIRYKAKDSSTGSRNLLRLHRALEFITMFLESLQDLEMTAKCCAPCQNAYRVTLMKHHPWVVQKGALMALHMLPTKEGLIHKICGDDLQERQKAEKTIPEAVQAMHKVYEGTQKIYEEHKLLDLP